MGQQIKLFKHVIYQYLRLSICAPGGHLHRSACACQCNFRKRKLHSPNDNVETLIPCLVLSLSPQIIYIHARVTCWYNLCAFYACYYHGRHRDKYSTHMLIVSQETKSIQYEYTVRVNVRVAEIAHILAPTTKILLFVC